MATNDIHQLSMIRGQASSAVLLERHFEAILDRCLAYRDVAAWTASSVSRSVFEVLVRECSLSAWRLHSITLSAIRSVVLPRAKPAKDSPEDLANNYVNA